ncbi:protein-L-isoaspartate(D-aspartate) O-methyltransferase [bacterium]|nr:protein-L-isoaspartate(D-aspartate) O-methyltransferase [bacterium]
MNNFDQHRLQMVEDQIRRRGISDKRVLNAMATVPRHLFIDEPQQRLAYFDGPLPIGHGQTISQPYIVAFMTEELRIKSHHSVLEIGTGCGYQSAVLAMLAKEVISLEYVAKLAETASKRLNELGYHNIQIHNVNGMDGWQENAPYDRIIGTAAPTSMPDKLIEQLAPQGRMIIPIGGSIFDQSLFIITKNKKNKVKIKRSLPVRFVPMVG